MKKTDVFKAISEAERFIKAAELAIKHEEVGSAYGGKYSAACKRASLDLTRALAEMRKPESY